MNLSTLLAEGGYGWTSYLLIGALILVLVLMFVVNNIQRKKQQEMAEQKIKAIEIGDKIKTIGMICGEVVELRADGTIVLLTGSEEYPSYIRIDKQAIYQIYKANEEMPTEAVSSEEAQADNGVFTELSDNAIEPAITTEEKVDTQSAEALSEPEVTDSALSEPAVSDKKAD